MGRIGEVIVRGGVIKSVRQILGGWRKQGGGYGWIDNSSKPEKKKGKEMQERKSKKWRGERKKKERKDRKKKVEVTKEGKKNREKTKKGEK